MLKLNRKENISWKKYPLFIVFIYETVFVVICTGKVTEKALNYLFLL